MSREILQNLHKKLARPIVPAVAGILAVIGGHVYGGIESATKKEANNSILVVASKDLNSEIVNKPGGPLYMTLTGLILIISAIGWDGLRNQETNKSTSKS